MLVFGPVPSRRLGRSLGINHIPPKTCSYACVYCQLGRTPTMQIERAAFYDPDAIVAEIEQHVAAAAAKGEPVDYLTFVPDGEPTLDLNLGRTIAAVKPLGIRIAVITNASLIGSAPVREELLQADWVSLKMDAVDEDAWRAIDRPHGHLSLNSILDGARIFAGAFTGTLVTETMLVAGVNDGETTLTNTADFVATLAPATAYLGIPTRPPAEPWVHAPDEATLGIAYALFEARVPKVEMLIGYEGNAFAATGDAAEDILSITAVHPMREDAMDAFLTRTDNDWTLVRELVASEQLTETAYGGHRFYLRTLAR